ncbi:MAG: hypothetical protein ACKO34_03385 [Vampirovibrionales bacterium]
MMSFFVIQTDSLADTQLANLLYVALLFFVPIALLLLMVLFRVWNVLHTLWDVLVHARTELIPLLQDARRTAEHVEGMTGSLKESVVCLQHSPSQLLGWLQTAGQQAKHWMGEGLQQVPTWVQRLRQSLGW